MATVLGGLPHYGNVHPRCGAAFWQKATTGQHRWMPTTAGGSLLAHVFNVLWAGAMQVREKARADYFVMLHGDVIPAGGWVDTLVAEIEWTGADVVSAVLPIKDKRGVTSTAIDDPDDVWTPLRRLTMTEVARLPETFSAADCGYPDNALLVNTGCWICDLRKPWVNEFPGFEIRDRIRRLPDGTPQAVCQPEDWNFSRWLHARGCKVLATRKVHADHAGEYRFPNDRVWGDETDPAYATKHGGRRVPPLAGGDGLPAGGVVERRGSAAACGAGV